MNVFSHEFIISLCGKAYIYVSVRMSFSGISNFLDGTIATKLFNWFTWNNACLKMVIRRRVLSCNPLTLVFVVVFCSFFKIVPFVVYKFDQTD